MASLLFFGTMSIISSPTPFQGQTDREADQKATQHLHAYKQLSNEAPDTSGSSASMNDSSLQASPLLRDEHSLNIGRSLLCGSAQACSLISGS
jgi:hypothetical protein